MKKKISKKKGCPKHQEDRHLDVVPTTKGENAFSYLSTILLAILSIAILYVILYYLLRVILYIYNTFV